MGGVEDRLIDRTPLRLGWTRSFRTSGLRRPRLRVESYPGGFGGLAGDTWLYFQEQFFL